MDSENTPLTWDNYLLLGEGGRVECSLAYAFHYQHLPNQCSGSVDPYHELTDPHLDPAPDPVFPLFRPWASRRQQINIFKFSFSLFYYQASVMDLRWETTRRPPLSGNQLKPDLDHMVGSGSFVAISHSHAAVIILVFSMNVKGLAFWEIERIGSGLKNKTGTGSASQ